jgi:hypothetical protein
MPSETTEAPDTGTEETEEATSEQETTDASTQASDELDKGSGLDWKAEAEKYKALARKHEQRAKTNAGAAKELEKFRESQLTEQEKAIKQAREEGLTEGRSVGDKRLIRAEVIAAAAGKAADPGDVYAILTGTGALSGVEVNGDGEVDTEAIRGLVESLVKDKPHLAAVRTPGFGARGQAPAERPEADMDAWIRGQAGR